MRVAIIAREFPPSIGGVQLYLKAVADELHKAGDEVIVITSGDRDTNFADNPYPVLNVNKSKEKPSGAGFVTASAIELLRLCRAQKPDAVLGGYIRSCGSAAMMAKRFFKVPFAVLAHGDELLVDLKNPIKRFATNQIVHKASCIIANSNYTKSLLDGFRVPNEKIHVVHPGSDLPDASPDAQKTLEWVGTPFEKREVVFSVGRLVPRKGFDVLIAACALLAHKKPQLLLIIAGDGPDKKRLVSFSAAIGVADRVLFTGEVIGPKLAGLYKAASVFAMPSRIEGTSVEGFGIVFLEAGRFSLPVVAGNSGGMPDAVQDGVTGFLVDPENPKAIAEAILKLLDDPILAQKIGIAGAKHAAQLTWKANAFRIKEILATAAKLNNK